MLRNHLNDFININFLVLPTSVSSSVAGLSGTTLASNNFFDGEIDVFEFVKDVETIAQITDSVFEISNDVKTLEAYLAANDPSYFANYESSNLSLQASIDAVFASATPGYADYFFADFSLFWESVSGVTSTFYTTLITIGGGLGAIFADSGTSIGNLAGGTFTSLANEIGATPASALTTLQILEVADFIETAISKFHSIGVSISSGATGGFNQPWDVIQSSVFQDLTSLIADYNDVASLISSLPSTGPLGKLLGVVALAGQMLDFISDNNAIEAASQNAQLSGLSQEFLDDAAFINRLELVDFFADMTKTVVDLLKVGGHAGGVVVYLTEAARTLSDLVATSFKSEWKIEEGRFDTYQSLVALTENYQNLLSSALSRADTLSGGVWGDNLASDIPTQPLAALSFFANLYDRSDEDGTFESGGTLTQGLSYTGSTSYSPFSDKGDWFQVTLVAGQDYEFSSLGPARFSSDLLLYSNSGILLAEDNSSASSNNNNVLRGTALEDGTYFVVVDGTTGTDYTINYSTISLTEDVTELQEAASSTNTGYQLSAGETFKGNINSNQFFDSNLKNDWIRVDLTGGTNYRLSYLEGTLSYGEITLYNEFGVEIAAENKSLTSSTNHVLEGTAMQTGTYFVAIESGNTGDYVLTFDTVTIATNYAELADAAANTTTLYSLLDGQTFHGNMNSADEDTTSNTVQGDWVRIDLSAGQGYRITIEEESLYINKLQIFDSNGMLYANSNSSLNSNSQSVIEGTATQSGTYYIASTGNGYAGSYTMSFDNVTLTETTHELLDAAADETTVYSLLDGETFRGNMNSVDGDTTSNTIQGDWVRIDLAAGQDYRITLDEESLYINKLQLFDSNGVLYANSNSSLSSNSQSVIEGTATQNGTYYIASTGNGYAGSYIMSFEITNSGPPEILGDSGNNTLQGSLLGEVIRGLGGDDIIFGGGGGDTLFGGSGNDKIYSGDGNDSVYLEDGNDYVKVGGGIEFFDGGNGVDTISYYDSTAGVKLNLATNIASGSWADDDTVLNFENVYASKLGNDHITGTSGANHIKTYAGNDKVYAGKGNDIVKLGDGDDYVKVGGGKEYFDGGAGIDTISYYDSTAGVKLNLATNTASGSWADNDTVKNFENVYASKLGNDHITGTSGANHIKTYAGNDKVYAGKGNDIVKLGDGDDYVKVGGGKEYFDGGAGIDTISYYDSTAGVKLNLATNTASGSWADNDTVKNFENVYASKLGNDHITGTAGANHIKTYGGNDKVYAGKGNDIVKLGDGDDYVKVGGGKEYFDGGAGVDTISYYDSTAGVKLNLATNTASGSWADNDTVKNFENVYASKLGNDHITGTAGANHIKTYGGNDKVYAGKGNDIVKLGDGDDFVKVGGGKEYFDGGAGIDTISYYDSTAGVKLNLATNTASGSWADNDTVKNFENVHGSKTGDDHITGTAGANYIKTYGGDDRVYSGDGDDLIKLGDGNDYVKSGAGNDIIYGGDGDDKFDAGAGDDTLYGGSGADIFHYDFTEGHDTIKDFENNIDTIELDNSGYINVSEALTHATQVGSDVVFDFGGGDGLTIEDTTKSQLINDLLLV